MFHPDYLLFDKSPPSPPLPKTERNRIVIFISQPEISSWIRLSFWFSPLLHNWLQLSFHQMLFIYLLDLLDTLKYDGKVPCQEIKLQVLHSVYTEWCALY